MHLRRLTLALLGITVASYFWYRRIGRPKYSKGNRGKEDGIIALEDKIPTKTEDLFDALPDEIVSLIVSAMSPREAIRISVLSKRLRHIYASLPNLNFDTFEFFMPRPHFNSKLLEICREKKGHFCLHATPKFVEVVDCSLKSYAGPDISSFRICFCYRRKYAHNVDRWISWAIGMGVENLDLQFVCFDDSTCKVRYDYKTAEMYPFSCEGLCEAPYKLKHLRLHSCTFLPPLPFSQRLTTLTTLDLNYISLAHGELYNIRRSCLNLKWLCLRKCTVPHKLHISRMFSLEFLSINSCEDVKEIELSAMNLTTFELADMAVGKLFFSWVPKLKNVHISSSSVSPCQKLDGRYLLSTLSKDLPQLEMLTVFLHTPEIEFAPTIFSKVQQLNLFLEMREDDFNFARSIVPLVRNFPFLQKLYVMLPPSWNRRDDACTSEVRTTELSRFSFPQLREVVFVGFHGTKNHIESVSYVLENAVALEQMIIVADKLRYQWCASWKTCSFYIDDESFNTSKESLRCQVQGKNISKNAKVIIKPGNKGCFLTRELVTKDW